MFPRDVAERFEREQGLTESDWLACLGGAVHGHRLVLAPQRADVHIDGGRLRLAWHALPVRQIGLVRLPRMQVDYRFEGVDADARSAFMRYFDLYMQRGGG